MRKERKNESLLWFGKWTSKLGNIVFDYANSVSIVGAFSHAPWVLALYQSSETLIQIAFNLIGGAKADSGSRKRILIVTDILAAVICFAASFFAASCRVTGFARSSFPSFVFLEMPRLCSTQTASGSFLNDSRSAHGERDCTRAGNAALTADSEILAVAYSSSSRMTC